MTDNQQLPPSSTRSAYRGAVTSREPPSIKESVVSPIVQNECPNPEMGQLPPVMAYLVSELKGLTLKFEHFRGELKNHGDEVLDMRREVQGFRIGMNSLTEKMDGLIHDLQEELPRLQHELASVVDEARRLRENVDVLRQERDDLQSKLAQQREEYNQVRIQKFREISPQVGMATASGAQQDELSQKFSTMKQAVAGLASDAVSTNYERGGPERRWATATFRATVSEYLLKRLTAESEVKRVVGECISQIHERMLAKIDQLGLLRLAEEWLLFTQQIATARPRGIVFYPEINVPFDPLLHEAQRGCEEAGQVTQLVFPGYGQETVSNRLIVKADVITNRPSVA
jgi:hypothetical protein